MTYQQSRAPIKVALSLGFGALMAFLVFSSFQWNKNASLKSIATECAKSHGVDNVSWKPMHGLHAFYIGEKFEAETSTEESIILCVIQQSDSIVTADPQMGEQGGPTLEIWFSESILGSDKMVYRPRSD